MYVGILPVEKNISEIYGVRLGVRCSILVLFISDEIGELTWTNHQKWRHNGDALYSTNNMGWLCQETGCQCIKSRTDAHPWGIHHSSPTACGVSVWVWPSKRGFDSPFKEIWSLFSGFYRILSPSISAYISYQRNTPPRFHRQRVHFIRLTDTESIWKGYPQYTRTTQDDTRGWNGRDIQWGVMSF